MPTTTPERLPARGEQPRKRPPRAAAGRPRSAALVTSARVQTSSEPDAIKRRPQPSQRQAAAIRNPLRTAQPSASRARAMPRTCGMSGSRVPHSAPSPALSRNTPERLPARRNSGASRPPGSGWPSHRPAALVTLTRARRSSEPDAIKRRPQPLQRQAAALRCPLRSDRNRSDLSPQRRDERPLGPRGRRTDNAVTNGRGPGAGRGCSVSCETAACRTSA